jgi:hypothetical protein
MGRWKKGRRDLSISPFESTFAQQILQPEGSPVEDLTRCMTLSRTRYIQYPDAISGEPVEKAGAIFRTWRFTDVKVQKWAIMEKSDLRGQVRPILRLTKG